MNKDKLKQLKNMLLMMKIWISKQKEIFNELADKRFNEINELDKKS